MDLEGTWFFDISPQESSAAHGLPKDGVRKGRAEGRAREGRGEERGSIMISTPARVCVCVYLDLKGSRECELEEGGSLAGIVTVVVSQIHKGSRSSALATCYLGPHSYKACLRIPYN
jgi:hypothetical protein